MTAVSLTDLYGNPVSSASRAAVDAYDRGVQGLLGFSADIIDCFRSALEADPGFVLARAALGASLYLAEKIPEGWAEMERAAAAAASLPVRERRHVEALSGRGQPGRAPFPVPGMRGEHDHAPVHRARGGQMLLAADLDGAR